MGVYLVIAMRNLLQARRRTGLLTVALALVSMLLVLLLSLSAGLSDTMIRAATLLSSGHVNVAGFYKTRPTSWSPLVTGAPALRELVRNNTPDLDFVIDRARGWARLISESSSLTAGLSGIDFSEETRLLDHLTLAEESEYKEGGRHEQLGSLDEMRRTDGVVIFAAQAKRLGVGPGDTLTITAETPGGLTNTTEGKIAAVARDLGFFSNFSAIVHKQLVADLYQLRPDTTGAIMVYLKDPSKSERTMGILRDALRQAGYSLMDHSPQPFYMKFEVVGGEDWTGQKLDLTTWEDELAQMKWVLSALKSISFFLMCVLLLMIAVGITNSMWIAVRERTGEIGTLRAIGMDRRRILAMFLTEAFVLGLVGTTLGAVCGAGIATVINVLEPRLRSEAVRLILMSDTLHLTLRPLHLAAAVAAFTLVTSLAALWPALRASRLQPVTAIHRIG